MTALPYASTLEAYPPAGSGVNAHVVDASCFHCGEPNAVPTRWRHPIGGRDRAFCCAGCLAIAQTIEGSGLASFYAQRSAAPSRSPDPVEGTAEHVAAAIASGLVQEGPAGEHEVSLIVEGMQCGACMWLIETWLRRQPDVVDASVNFAMRRARVRWHGPASALGKVLDAVSAIGYQAHVYDRRRREALLRREKRMLLLRTGVALLAMMQVMMLAIPAYIGDDTIERGQQALLDWASLVLTLPVVLFSAWPFASGAWRSVRMHRVGMDVPVAIGVAGAFLASAWAIVAGHGAVYFDSITMFVALLLVARYAELCARAKASAAIESVAREVPLTAERLTGRGPGREVETVPASGLAAGDSILVSAGGTIPADGLIVDGASSVEEALVTGESRPLRKRAGERVLAGSVNRESPLVVRVEAAGSATTLAALARMVDRAADARPRSVALADLAAGWFVATLLCVAAAAAWYWWRHDPSRAIGITFAILAISCPCALSLATPAAAVAAAGALGRRGILAVRSGAFEVLARVTHVVLDKTGTLTVGRAHLVAVESPRGWSRDACVAIAAALEQGAAHPIATALRAAGPASITASDVVNVSGEGVQGVVDGKRYRCGRPVWAAGLAPTPTPAAPATSAESMVAALADEAGCIAVFTLDDPLRPGARDLVARLTGLGIDVRLLSGDRAQTVRRVADETGVEHWHADARPGDKVAFIRALQRDGAVVAMIGDGINDAPSLKQADVSIAIGDAATLTRWSADMVALGDDSTPIAAAFDIARRTRRVIRQNLAWAFAYNAIGIPAAAFGLVTPLAAAVGMSLSSMLVVANSLRLLRA